MLRVSLNKTFIPSFLYPVYCVKLHKTIKRHTHTCFTVHIDIITERLKEARNQGLRKLKKISCVQLILAVIACAIGVASLVYGVQENPQWPYMAGFGLWIGVLVSCLNYGQVNEYNNRLYL